MRRRLYVLSLLAFTNCTWLPHQNSKTISSSVELNQKSHSYDYIAAFETKEDAQAHETDVLKQNGLVEKLGETVLHVTVSANTAANLSLPQNATALNNSTVRIQGRSVAPDADPTPDQIIQDAVAHRKVTGVNELVARFPQADGRGVKVAVFDTGIDFGVEGLSDKGKLKGFYDFTEFGKVTSTSLTDTAVQAKYDIQGISVDFDNATIGALETLSTGVLDEKEQALHYLAGEGIDLDGNKVFTDKFPYIIGKNKDGKLAAWIDTNRNGKIDGRDEELTDFNETLRYIDVAPGLGGSKTRPIAVTIQSATEVQFHSVPESHATGCGIIIAGDGYLEGKVQGLAPKADLYSYVLDVSGQDVYTLAQFLAMFTHARDHGMDAISISWGFSTADSRSAKFVGDFLDNEIARKGVLIAIAAGNEGPGVNSATPDDYIPRTGFAVGAHLAEEQIENVYGWTGANTDSVVWYSSFGATGIGRAVPDLVSPISTLVRTNRVSDARFYGFSGTSSATPALVGSMSALVSALKQNGETAIDTRVLKLALQNTASVVPDVEAIRQGPGLVNVNKAYDLYKKLIAEKRAAEADQTHRTHQAYELKANIASDRLPVGVNAEGVMLDRFRDSSLITLTIASNQQGTIDPLTFIEPLVVSHGADFFEAPKVVNLQAAGAKLTLKFDADKLAKPGIYTDTLTFARADGLVLLRTPVIMRIGAEASSTRSYAVVSEQMKPFDLVRKAVQIDQPSQLIVEGLVQDLGGNTNGRFGIMVNAVDGHKVVDELIPVTLPSQPISVRSELLPAGTYEIVFYRHFGQPATLGNILFAGNVRAPWADVVGTNLNGQTLEVAAVAKAGLAIGKVQLEADGDVVTTKLTLDKTAPRPGFIGTLELPTFATDIFLGLRQNAIQNANERFFAMSVAFVNVAQSAAMYRGWIDVEGEKSPLRPVTLNKDYPTTTISVLAYPNIVNWNTVQTKEVTLLAKVPYEETKTIDASSIDAAVGNGQVTTWKFDVSQLSDKATKAVKVYGTDGKLLEVLPL